VLGGAFYRSRRREEGALEAVGGGTPAATIKARWSFSGRPLREGEKGEGAGRRRVSARCTRGEGEETRGRGRGIGKATAWRGHGVALGRREVRDDPDGWVPPVGKSVRKGVVGVG
jgi:hypothetical protein